ncbi:c-type cytochrome [Novosphingobium mangrovi (ex Huang et al. 2023)]|uniref:Cytochrome c family protein n=1 Tax=Novosphingobium mangrovi (ex Huang et al. 2023) TaxID=2976432 RepID=A0ABT2I2R0_9SPHN|nr:cytochrome c family protein [Novosphingobium mangrovi (ex Huang et al. 2023)]MCT2399090.1 cytochrome c family protein [Novosphingobium mangrovi (ex Huang et al. 2023)]
MSYRNLVVIAPFALLAACGGSGPDETSTAEATPATEAMASSTPEAAMPSAEATASETPAAEKPAPEATTATPSPAPTTEASAIPAAAVAAAQPQVAAKPPAAFAVCRACHSVEPAKNGVGPTLFAIAGSKAGEVPNYAFSPALKKSGITWDRASLDTWLQGPMKMVPGTKMVISVPDAAKRKAIIDYLETLK